MSGADKKPTALPAIGTLASTDLFVMSDTSGPTTSTATGTVILAWIGASLDMSTIASGGALPVAYGGTGLATLDTGYIYQGAGTSVPITSPIYSGSPTKVCINGTNTTYGFSTVALSTGSPPITALASNGTTVNAQLGSYASDNGVILVNDSAGALKCRIYSAGTSYMLGGSFGLGTSSFGASASGVLCIANGTQGAALANAIQIVSEDLSAGNTILSLRTEGTAAVGTGTPTANRTVAMKINGTVYYFLASTIP